jgi:hypothetical protein
MLLLMSELETISAVNRVGSIAEQTMWAFLTKDLEQDGQLYLSKSLLIEPMSIMSAGRA